jgi:hypothetical protein
LDSFQCLRHEVLFSKQSKVQRFRFLRSKGKSLILTEQLTS